MRFVIKLIIVLGGGGYDRSGYSGGRLQQSSLFSKLVRGARAALMIQIVSAAALYGSQVLLARWMGTAEYGIYDYAIAIGLFWAFVAGFGLPTAVLRFISVYRVQEDWPHLKGMIWGSWQQTWVVGVTTALGGTAVLWGVHAGNDLGAYAMPMLVGLWAIPVVALLRLQQEIIRAFQKMVLSYAPSLIAQPVLLVMMVMIWQRWQELTSVIVISLSLLSSILVLLLQWLFFQYNLDIKIRNAQPAYEMARWWRIALPLMLLSGSRMFLSQTDTLMIGIFLNAKQVGLYSAALKTSAWVNFILVSVNAITAPLIASLYAQGDRHSLQQLVSTIARWMFYPALAVAVGLIVFAEPVLQLFGSEFVAAKGALVILSLGQLVNVGAGSVGYLMIMTGHQNQSVIVMVVSAIVNVILNLIGIHMFGIVGAAMATAFAMAMWNIWLYSLVVRNLGVRPSILDALRW
ncbi:flippase [Leptothoe spongobia]|uniref:Flippase n=1 Tax=Leptothoe spongobia TAU-MAC 1115 TaxID=1967444 RepID=A0A947GKZ6_9CYAN|nr:flippase [Leptothoe spongobia]MBT9314711.1 flippase [Leptothoe spongobia TAU-MAC 1115]